MRFFQVTFNVTVFLFYTKKLKVLTNLYIILPTVLRKILVVCFNKKLKDYFEYTVLT